MILRYACLVCVFLVYAYVHVHIHTYIYIYIHTLHWHTFWRLWRCGHHSLPRLLWLSVSRSVASVCVSWRLLHSFLCLKSFQTTLTPNPNKFYNYCSAWDKQKHMFERALQMLSSSGAGGLVTVHCCSQPRTSLCFSRTLLPGGPLLTRSELLLH